MAPQQVLEKHGDIWVVRDDLFPGGTKARFLPLLFEGVDEVVYASPCEGGAQTAIATVAQELGKRATIFVAKRNKPHDRAYMAKRLGAKVFQVPAGRLNVVQCRARTYAEHYGAKLLPFGLRLPEGIAAIANAARAISFDPREVWCAAGSGTLTKALALAFPHASIHCVQVGRQIKANEVDWASIHAYPLAFGQECKTKPPFPSDPHYDAKAWELCQRMRGPGPVLFWNVTGPAVP
jgi:hypothetical protein